VTGTRAAPDSPPPVLTRERVAAHALERQLLGSAGIAEPGPEGAARVVEHLGYVQIDTISVVERAHHLTLRTRCPGYRPAMLDRLLATDRRVFEYWGHAASYLPMCDYRFYTTRMREFADPADSWFRSRLEEHGHLMGDILERIRGDGPLAARDFAAAGWKRSGWWDWKPAKTALELLFWRGDLMVSRRDGFERVYDLAERVLPSGTDIREPEPDELGRFLVRRALSAHGTATPGEIADHIHAAGRGIVREALADLVASGEVVEIAVDGEEGFYALPEVLEDDAPAPAPGPLRLLSPFDNLIIRRDRTRRLFGFDYALECYVPAARRRHGYFVLPMLYGGRLVGRLDPKADRKAERLLIRSLSLEPGVSATADLLDALARELSDFAAFHGCRGVVPEEGVPAAVRRGLGPRLRLVAEETGR